MSTKAILAAIAGAVFAFLLGWVIFGILLMDFYADNTTRYEGLMKEMPDMALIIINNFILGFFLAFLFERWAGIKSLGGGIKGGIIVGLPVALSFDLYMMAGMNLFTPTLIIVDVIVNTIFTALVGGLIGFILGTGKKANA